MTKSNNLVDLRPIVHAINWYRYSKAKRCFLRLTMGRDIFKEIEALTMKAYEREKA